MKKSRKNGFTLTEILIVIVIIGIILAIAIPSIVAIRKRINERLLESKKDMILVAAELWGKDKEITEDTVIYVYTLLGDKYLDADVEANDRNCSGNNTADGCIINPVDDTSLNDVKILLKADGSTIIAVWDGELGSSTSKEIVDAVKEQLNCGTITESNPCIYTGNNPNNYLYYSGIMWRIIGVYKIDGILTVKMITDENVILDTNT